MASNSTRMKAARSVSDALLHWYDHYGRDLPWRKTKAPYRIWLSEIMLQQTIVTTVIPYYQRFLEGWPTVSDLAKADLDDVLVAWQGLGYYARARHLHQCAQVIDTRYGGIFPSKEEELRALPGVGDYTAAAIAAIAFDQPATVIDGNIMRVFARFWALQDPVPGLKQALIPLAAGLTPQKRPGDYAQALMDLGAMICKPRLPECPACPISRFCQGYQNGMASSLPVRRPKRPKPHRFGSVFWLSDPKGRIYLRRRPSQGLLGGMMEFPGSVWQETPLSEPCAHAPLSLDWVPVKAHVSHIFTHFTLELSVFRGHCDTRQGRHLASSGKWVKPDDFAAHALPSLMQKVARRAMEG